MKHDGILWIVLLAGSWGLVILFWLLISTIIEALA